MKKLTLAGIIAAVICQPAAWAEDDLGCLKVTSEDLGMRTVFSCTSAEGAASELVASADLIRYVRDDRTRAFGELGPEGETDNLQLLRTFDAAIDQALLDDLLEALGETPAEDPEEVDGSGGGVTESSASAVITAEAKQGEAPTISVETEQSGDSSVDVEASASNETGTATETVSVGDTSGAPDLSGSDNVNESIASETVVVGNPPADAVKPAPSADPAPVVESGGSTESTSEVSGGSASAEGVAEAPAGEIPTVDIETAQSGNSAVDAEATATNEEGAASESVSEGEVTAVPDSDSEDRNVNEVIVAEKVVVGDPVEASPADEVESPKADDAEVGFGASAGASNESGSAEVSL